MVSEVIASIGIDHDPVVACVFPSGEGTGAMLLLPPQALEVDPMVTIHSAFQMGLEKCIIVGWLIDNDQALLDWAAKVALHMPVRGVLDVDEGHTVRHLDCAHTPVCDRERLDYEVMRNSVPIRDHLLDEAVPVGEVVKPDDFEWSEDVFEEQSSLLSSIVTLPEGQDGNEWSDEDYRWAAWSMSQYPLVVALMWLGVQAEHGSLVPILKRLVRASHVCAPQDAAPPLMLAAWFTMCLGDTQLAREFVSIAKGIDPEFAGVTLMEGITEARLTPEQMYDFAQSAFGETFGDDPDNMRL